MRLSRGGGHRFSNNIWPGYVDAVTTLLMVIMFALTIAMVVQAVLREQITQQDSQLGELGSQIAQLAGALSDTQGRAEGLDRDLAAERARLSEERARLALSQSDLGDAREQIDAQEEAAKLSAARRAALEALLADLRKNNADLGEDLAKTRTDLSDADAARLADAAAAQALAEKLSGSQAELTAMTLQLEAQRKHAQETLTLLAAAEAAKQDLQGSATAQATEAQKQAALLALAQQKLSEQEALSGEDQRRVVLLNEQVADLTSKLGNLQAVLDAAGEVQKDAELRVEDLGQQLNAALLRAAEEEKRAADQERKAADEERRSADLERQAREKAEAEAADLSRYRSEFFGRLSQILQGRQGVQVVGDRFVFSSEVLFPTGEATLSDAGREQIRNVTNLLGQVSAEIPPEIDWIIRVDGHTDNLPLTGQGRYRDNWELSQARALAVVRYMVNDLGFPANRLAATGFGDTRPVAAGDSDEARAQNRRIELKLTER